uniref:AlNc14C505G11970 protein n=1 Tax=Albugo laibachii Nc14 TaxID=890382 RepID=F0X0M5_9STRA|nr:AlNc14C505G11970 [Albugo laibachii Nc14]|eukprot:CCA27317.1 AlNc14C505G11970 [Albugo laibachii Nc14]
MRNDQMKKKMVEKEVDSRGGEKRCRRSDSPVASVHLPASVKESSGLGQQNVWTKGSAYRDNIRHNQSTEEEEISNYPASDVSQCAAECSVSCGDDTIAEIEQYTANSIASINTGKWKDGKDILKDSVARTKRKLGGKLMSMVWKFYYVSIEKNAFTRRARAKCKFCHFELDGRQESMLSHIENCKAILPHDRHQVYTMLASKQ